MMMIAIAMIIASMKSVSVAMMIPAMGTAMVTMTGTMMVIRRAMQI